MSDQIGGNYSAPGGDQVVAGRYYKRDFWSEENLKFAKPGFRQLKAARIVNGLAGDAECDLLDVGCGPAALMHFVRSNVHYHGVDIAIQEPAPNLLEADLSESPIQFMGKKFDIVVAQGFFEYIGEFQEQKFAEISKLLKDGGRFLVSYVNFGHRDREIYWPYNNVQPASAFRQSLARYFRIHRSFPTSHNWFHSEPNRRFMTAPQMYLNMNVPLISRKLAVEYFFVCSARAVPASPPGP